MTRADRLEAALRKIVSTEYDHDPLPYIRAVAKDALDREVQWPGTTQYNAPEDAAIAREWFNRHIRADELVFIKGRPVIALYYEPVADHYQQARRHFREFAEKLRAAFEADWL